MSGRESVAEQVPSGEDTLGTRLRVERDHRGVTLRELARRLEVSPSLLSQIETGKTQPSVRTLYAIVSELGVSLDDVFAPLQQEGGPVTSVTRRGRRADEESRRPGAAEGPGRVQRSHDRVV